jgi:hypothetical protein
VSALRGSSIDTWLTAARVPCKPERLQRADHDLGMVGRKWLEVVRVAGQHDAATELDR